MRLSGRVAVVTGASRGLGRAIAQRLAQEGAYVYCTYASRIEAAHETVALLRASDGQGEALALDLRDRASIRTALGHVLTEQRQIDVLVNNAGVCRDQHFAVMSEEDWDDVIRVNLTGVALSCHAVIRSMMARSSGSIVNVASVAGRHASPGQANYAASKGGLLAFTKTLAAEVAARGIRVNAVVPGLIASGMAERLSRQLQETKRQAIGMKRLGTAEEIAAAVAFLASDDASYVTGAELVVDGGLST
jgi:3-oxoacyl-[acyl-carrier protein] reductase